MDIRIVQEITGEYFNEYPIFTNVNAIRDLAIAYNLTDIQVDDILKALRRNVQFFEERKAIQYGLVNLFIYALDAMYVPESSWNPKRAEITAEYKRLLHVQAFFTINLQ